MAKSAGIVFASMTGNTEEIAEIVSENLKNNGIDVSLNEVTEADIADLQKNDIIVIASYTYGDGDLPDEMVDFAEELKEQSLENKTYGVIGSGDTSYGSNFCKAVDIFDIILKNAGAKKAAENVKIEFDVDDDDKNKIKKFTDSLSA
jgi:flavodoxin short chain